MDDEISSREGRRTGLRPKRQRVWESDSSTTSSSPVRGATSKRGRGKAAARGRGRGGKQRGDHRGEVAAAALTEREESLQERIEEMSNDERKELLLKTGEKHPSLLMNLIDKGSPQGGFHPGPSGEQPNWCSCLKCRDMPTQTERVCCGRQPNQCLSEVPDFRLLVLDELVLHVAQMYRQDVLALPNDADYNKGKRHAAYRQFILWQHGRLGIGVRMVIPSCCVWTIRDKFPDQYGQYVGFIPSRLG